MSKELYVIYKSFLKDESKNETIGIVDNINKAKKYCNKKNNESINDEKYYYEKFRINNLDESNVEITIGEYDNWHNDKCIEIEKRFTNEKPYKKININVLGYSEMKIITNNLKEDEYYLNLFKIVNKKIKEGISIDKINALFL